MWELKIEKIENGFIMSHREEIEDDKFIIRKEVIEEEFDDEKKTMTQLLERVAEYFGIQEDRYGKDNLKITWNKKGRKA
ncbi:MAG: hypothetical protein UR66_C0013G0022 [Candidatus Moranbacteria bacterium GW2011_GWE1_35_17]|nr:MAG: hypothetical protein UR66_C0013G0022 [Candidatus Moranbacteria bacterium GW2011_GWE1_35_17]KKP71157.1 MAG: hypothetical protein UR65_C0036G0002 [Candidatus Moranbacteria bacterium GW2011_GWE2_35_164]KKP83915.1 MAG: hypothetical protein UR82_C0016G0015 [Candidatus Moranbacteria bacterium GW2011_GWF1_35_5]KKP84684.1 MAG: hypothetical protein UR83_C0015G0002 [Candidatus Moranbacteria bacterium GW2011_GWF2_35_54]